MRAALTCVLLTACGSPTGPTGQTPDARQPDDAALSPTCADHEATIDANIYTQRRGDELILRIERYDDAATCSDICEAGWWVDIPLPDPRKPGTFGLPVLGTTYELLNGTPAPVGCDCRAGFGVSLHGTLTIAGVEPNRVCGTIEGFRGIVDANGNFTSSLSSLR